jgi:maleylpyruvate isomerase
MIGWAAVEDRLERLRQARDWYLQAFEALPEDGWGKPSLCAGWTAAHVVAHVLTGDQLTRAMVLDALGRDRSQEDLPLDFAERRRRMEEAATWPPERLASAARTASEASVAAVTEVFSLPSAIVHMPFGDVPPPIVVSLRLNEYVIHGHDLSPAIGDAIPTPDWFILSALPESVNLMARLHQRSPHKGKTASFHLHRSDGEGEWTLMAREGQAAAEPGHGKADAAFRGSGEGLYWVLMGRGAPSDHGVEVHGDQELASVFKEWFPGP